jgi:CheY-like chemotaxis protein
MQMPGMDGLTLATEIRKLPGMVTMPLILLTSMGVRTDTPGFAGAGFASCLTKPIKPAQLQEILVRVLSGAKPASRKAPVSSKLDPALAERLPLRMLLCDDNVINQKVAMRLLQQMGYKPDLAANGIEALNALDNQTYDLIFMDVQMPEMDGLEATRRIRERQNDRVRFPNYKSPIIIVAMTANAMAGDREKCIAAGMDDYIAKPVRPEDVRSIVERWGSSAAMAETPSPTMAQTATATGPLEVDGTVVGNARPEPPVDMERLLDFTNGNADDLRELVALYLKQTAEQIEHLGVAVRSNSTQEVRRLAHSCAGANATCGMIRIVPMLRELERQGDEGRLVNAVEISDRVEKEFQAIRAFLETFMANHFALAAKS